MTVTKVEAITKTKFRVELDGEFAFVLYKGELKRFGIREDAELEEETREMICREVILKRAKLRALHLLADMARTEKKLREKLRQSQYPEPVIDEAVEYVRSFGYLDDVRYAENFIESRKNGKSRKEMYAALLQRGVPADVIDRAFEAYDPEEEETEAIRRLVARKGIDVRHATKEEIHKLYGYLARKGFPYEAIRRGMGETKWDC